MFDLLYQEHGSQHKLTKPNYPWTDRQVERINRTLKEATVKRCHYKQLRADRRRVTMAPAMAAAISSRLWEMTDIVALIDAAEVAPNHPAFYRKRADTISD
jgi:hypothetical protein